MFVPQTPSPLRQIGIGAALSLLAFGALLLSLNGCGSATTAQCKLNALKILPDDPKMVTPYDAEDLINRLKACEAGPDGGAP